MPNIVRLLISFQTLLQVLLPIVFLQKNPFIQVERIDPFTARFILNHYIELTLC
jgi:hypothetical protein